MSVVNISYMFIISDSTEQMVRFFNDKKAFHFVLTNREQNMCCTCGSWEVFVEVRGFVACSLTDKIDVPLLCQTNNVIKVMQPWCVPELRHMKPHASPQVTVENADTHCKLFRFYKMTLIVSNWQLGLCGITKLFHLSRTFKTKYLEVVYIWTHVYAFALGIVLSVVRLIDDQIIDITDLENKATDCDFLVIVCGLTNS